MDRSTKNAQGPLSQLDRPSQDRFQLRIQVTGSTPAPNQAPKGNPCSESSSQSSTSAPGLAPKIDWSLDPSSQALLEVGIQLPGLIPARNPPPKLEFRSEFSSRHDSGSRPSGQRLSRSTAKGDGELQPQRPNKPHSPHGPHSEGWALRCEAFEV